MEDRTTSEQGVCWDCCADRDHVCSAVKMSIRDADIGNVHNQVKSPWYLEVRLRLLILIVQLSTQVNLPNPQISPNGKIPTITHDGFSVFETSAILDYLGQTFDKENKFTWDRAANPKEFSEQLQWLFFTVSRRL